ncbi:MAG: 50S ribosomal protein L18 [Candidatus Omnitrophica bacterium]|nr:50S ribosomal protein L18 [Candidatus Omnitrophota bacterium]
MDKKKLAERRKKSIRKKISGSSERPRMAVRKSNRNLFVSIIDDVEGKTLCGASTLSKEIKGKKAADTRKNLNFAEMLGEVIAKKAAEKGVKKVAFDRGGNHYHGVIKALADAARKNGLEF